MKADDFFKLVEEEKKKKKQTPYGLPRVDTGRLTRLSTYNDNASTNQGEEGDFFSLVEQEKEKKKQRDALTTRRIETERAKKEKAKDEAKWYKGWFQEGPFEDGFDVADIPKVILGTFNDINENVTYAVLDATENLIDTGADVVGWVGSAFDKDFRKDVDKFIAKEPITYKDNAEKLNKILNWSRPGGALANLVIGEDDTEDYSVLSDKSDSLVQSATHMVGSRALGLVGVPWWLTQGVNAYGSELEASLQSGESTGNAHLDAVIGTAAEIFSEKLFGGSGLGEKGLIDTSGLTKGIKNKIVKALADYGVDMATEASEEVISQFATNVGKTFYKEEDALYLLFGEEAMNSYIESAIGGAIISGGMNVGKVRTSIKTGRDYSTGLTTDEQSVVDKAIEIEIAKREANGTKLTKSEKAKIEEYVNLNVKKGYISTDVIESVLGGESYKTYRGELDKFFGSDEYKTYKDTVTKEDAIQKEFDELKGKESYTLEEMARFNDLLQEVKNIKNTSKRAELKASLDKEATRIAGLRSQMRGEVLNRVKNSYLAESYRESARSKEKFTTDVTKYTDENAKKTVQSILDSGIGDNTNQFHETVEFLARLSADKGVTFDMTNDELLQGTKHFKEGFRTNGYVSDDGKIVLNWDSQRAINTTVGHEITHVLEKAGAYKEMRSALFNYAISKEGKKAFNKRLKDAEEAYKGLKNTSPEAEVAADLVGEYLFTDYEFVNNLSKTNRNVFQKMYDEIKYLCKIAVAGSREARELEKVKRAFQKAYNENIKGKPVENEQHSFSSIANTFFGDENMSTSEFFNEDYHETEGYKDYLDQCLNNMRQSRADFDEDLAKVAIQNSIDGIVRVAVASKQAGYDIADSASTRDIRDSKKRLLFSSLEPNSDYFTSHDISTICDKRKNFAEIYDEIVRREEAVGVPKGKRFFDNVNNYFAIHKIMADKGLTTPCRQCYVESMRKNLAPMATAFLNLVSEKNPNNTANEQLYHQKGKSKGKEKTSNASTREFVLSTFESHPEYNMTVDDLTVEMLTTEDGLAQLRIQAPLIYEAFNSFYGQAKPKMPKSATPFRFGELSALLTDEKGNIKKSLVDKINSTGGFRLQSYSDFQIQNYVDVLQVLFEAGTLGLNGHAYTKVPAFLDATEGTNLKRNISIFMYKDGDQWKLDRNDSFPDSLEEIYERVKADKTGNTSIIAVSQNADMSAWIMANDYVGYGIPFHKSGLKMGVVRDTVVRTEDGRLVKGYTNAKDHTKQQAEVWAKTTADHKAYTKVKKGINVYSFWDFDNKANLSKNELIEKNVKAYIDQCEMLGYLPKFREYVMNNGKVLNDVLKYSKELGFVGENATIDDISFEYKGYRIPYGYYKFLGDFGMFTPDGKASPQQILSLESYDFDKAVDFFSDAETLRRNEILQQFANGKERRKYKDSNLTAEELEAIAKQKRQEVAEEVVPKYSLTKDSDGNQLTKEQSEFFKDTTVLDAEGNLQKVYHTSPTAGFTVFNGGEGNGNYKYGEYGNGIAFFTDNKAMADSYGDESSGQYEGFLNLKNPYVVDAEGRPWNRVANEFSQETYDRYQTLTEEEKIALSQLASWEDIGIFRSELREAKNGSDDQSVVLASAYEKLDDGNLNMYRLFDIATDGFTEESMREYSVKTLNTNDIVEMALQEGGYDGVIIRNVVDYGGHAPSNPLSPSGNVYVMFESNQFKNADNTNPTANEDIRYSLSKAADTVDDAIWSIYNYDTAKKPDGNPVDRMVVDFNIEEFTKQINDRGNYHSVVESIVKQTGKTRQEVWNTFSKFLMQKEGIAKVDGKTYINVHELSEEHLRDAFELGGLAAPSIGIVDVDAPSTHFGRISLIFPDVFNPDTNPTFYGDSYSTSFPATARFSNRTTIEDALTYGFDGMEYAGILTQEEIADLIQELEQMYIYDTSQRTSHTISENGFRDVSEFASNWNVKGIKGLHKLYKGLEGQFDSYEHFLTDFAEKVFTEKRIHKDNRANSMYDFDDRAYNFMDYTLGNAVDEMTANSEKDFKFATGERVTGYDELLSDGMRARLKDGSTNFYEVKPQRAVYIDEATYAVVPENTSADVIEMLEAEGVKVVKYSGIDGVTDGKAEAIKGILEEDTSGIRFSLSKAVEETKDLIAMHNLKADELLKSFDLGGFPMPSIAVIKADAGHEQYGDISLVFPKDTIDPKNNKANKVYGGDAWTPTYPRIEYKPNEDVAKRVSDKYYELAGKFGHNEAKPLYRYNYEMENVLNFNGGEANMLERLYNDTEMMQLYLQDVGKGKVEPVTTETVTKMTDAEIEMSQYVINALGEDLIADFKVPSGQNPITYRNAYMAEHDAEIKEAYKQYFMDVHQFTEEQVNNVLENTSKGQMLKYIRNAFMYTQNNGVTTKTETDYEATREAIRNAAEDGYKEWVDSLFKGVEEKTGIRNNLDAYTPSGKHRGWESLHWANTLENVVKAMKQQDQTGADAMFGVHKIFSVAAKDYGSIEDIKKDSDRLRKIPQEEYEKAKDEFTDRFSAIAFRLMDKDHYNSFIAKEQAMEGIVDAVRSSKTKNGISKKLTEYGMEFTESDVDDIVSLVNDIANMPTGYFEAKPQRAVGFDEVAVFVIPRNADIKLKQELLSRGYNIAEYDPDVEGDRTKVVNQLDDYKFSLTPEGEMPTEHGNYNVYSKDFGVNDPLGEFNIDLPVDEKYQKSPEADIGTVEDRLEGKIKHLQAELDKNREYREQSLTDYDNEIARKQAEYDSKKNKSSRTAQGILRTIERLTRLKNSIDADYGKRIENLEARIERMSTPEYRTAEQRRAKMQEHTDYWETLIGDTSTWKDMALGLAYKTKTLRRILRKVVRGADGKPDIAKADAIYDALETKYDHNEALLKKESRKLKDVFQKLNLNKHEDAYAHMLGEFRHNPQTTLTEDVVNEYYNKHKSKIDATKVDTAITEARKTFDELIVRVNEVLREQGMKEIPYRQGYFPHFTKPKQNWLQKLLNWKPVDNEIPTSIAGLTEMFEPQRSWQTFNKQRTGDTTDYSLYQGLDTYIHGALDWIYHIDDLQSRRSLENYIRYIHSEEGIKARIDEIKANESYDADETQQMIESVLAEAKNPLNNLVTELRARTNTLANKKASMDRGMEEATNRKIYSTMTNLNNRINANMVVGSFSSALTNFIPMVQSWHQVSPLYTVRGLGDYVRSVIRDDGTVAKSDFLTNRLLEEENLYQTGWDKASDKAAIMMNVIDSITSQTVWRSKYLQNISEGMSEVEAIKDADQFAKNLMAGRSRGNAPSIFDAKNPLIKMLTSFQLEVANQYGYMFEDVPQDSTNKVRLVKGYATAFLGAYMYNALYSSLVGRNAAFDPISIFEDLFRDLGWIGDDEEEEPEDIALNFVDNILQEVPFVGGLFGGGRVPISSAMPYNADYETFFKDVANGEVSTKELLKPLYYLVLPFGGGQIKKTNEGIAMFDDDLPVSGSYTESGKLRYPVEKNFGNVTQAVLFGQYASKNARDYFDNNRTPLGKEQIDEYLDLDIPIRDYWDYREGLKGKNTLEEKLSYIDSLDLPVRKQNILANNVTDRKDPIDMTDWGNYSGLEEFDYAKKNPGKYAVSRAVTNDFKEYKQYTSALNDIHEGDATKDRKIAYINSLDISYGAKMILFKSQYKKDDTYNYEIIEYLNSTQEFAYEEKVAILEELGFTVYNDGTIVWD